jgi:hypothetical protein
VAVAVADLAAAPPPAAMLAAMEDYLRRQHARVQPDLTAEQLQQASIFVDQQHRRYEALHGPVWLDPLDLDHLTPPEARS